MQPQTDWWGAAFPHPGPMVMGHPHFKKGLECVLRASCEQSISFNHLVSSFSHPCPFSSLRARGPKSCCCLMEQIIMELIKAAALLFF